MGDIIDEISASEKPNEKVDVKVDAIGTIRGVSGRKTGERELQPNKSVGSNQRILDRKQPSEHTQNRGLLCFGLIRKALKKRRGGHYYISEEACHSRELFWCRTGF